MQGHLVVKSSVRAEGMQHVGVRDAQTDKCAARHIIDDLSLMTSQQRHQLEEIRVQKLKKKTMFIDKNNSVKKLTALHDYAQGGYGGALSA